MCCFPNGTLQTQRNKHTQVVSVWPNVIHTTTVSRMQHSRLLLRLTTQTLWEQLQLVYTLLLLVMALCLQRLLLIPTLLIVLASTAAADSASPICLVLELLLLALCLHGLLLLLILADVLRRLLQLLSRSMHWLLLLLLASRHGPGTIAVMLHLGHHAAPSPG